MSILRVEKTKRYSIIANDCFADSRLSYRAVGLLCYLLSKPNDWRVQTSELTKAHSEGRDATLATLKELRTCGYITLEKGFGGVDYTVRERPLDADYQEPENQGTDNQGTGKPTLLRTDYDQGLSEQKTDTTVAKKTKENPQGNATTSQVKQATKPAAFLSHELAAVVKAYPQHRVSLNDKEGIVDTWNAIVAVEPGTAGVIAHDITQRKASDDWQKDGGRWVPNLIKYLKSRGWEMPIVIVPPPPGHLHPKEGQATMIWGVDY